MIDSKVFYRSLHAANGDSLQNKVLSGRLSPIWHQNPVKLDENEGKPVKSNSAQTIDRQADLIDFVQLARSTESLFETARFNHSRTSPNPYSSWFPSLADTVTLRTACRNGFRPMVQDRISINAPSATGENLSLRSCVPP